MAKLTVKDLDVKSKRVLVRVDFNVPIDDNNEITDDNRIVASLPTIKYLIDQGAKVILCSHLGRPKGKFEEKYSLSPVATRLAGLLPETRVEFARDVIGPDAQEKASSLKDGRSSCLKTSAFIRRKQITTRGSQRGSHPLPTYLYPTHSARCIGRMPQPPAWRNFCLRQPGF